MAATLAGFRTGLPPTPPGPDGFEPGSQPGPLPDFKNSIARAAMRSYQTYQPPAGHLAPATAPAPPKPAQAPASMPASELAVKRAAEVDFRVGLPNLVIDRPKGYKKTFKTMQGPAEVTYPVDYGYLSDHINPDDNEGLDVFVGSGGPNHGRFMKGNSLTGKWKPDERKWYAGLTNDELASVRGMYEGQSPGLLRDFATYRDVPSLLKDVAVYRQPMAKTASLHDWLAQLTSEKQAADMGAGVDVGNPANAAKQAVPKLTSPKPAPSPSVTPTLPAASQGGPAAPPVKPTAPAAPAAAPATAPAAAPQAPPAPNPAPQPAQPAWPTGSATQQLPTPPKPAQTFEQWNAKTDQLMAPQPELTNEQFKANVARRDVEEAPYRRQVAEQRYQQDVAAGKKYQPAAEHLSGIAEPDLKQLAMGTPLSPDVMDKLLNSEPGLAQAVKDAPPESQAAIASGFAKKRLAMLEQVKHEYSHGYDPKMLSPTAAQYAREQGLDPEGDVKAKNFTAIDTGYGAQSSGTQSFDQRWRELSSDQPELDPFAKIRLIKAEQDQATTHAGSMHAHEGYADDHWEMPSGQQLGGAISNARIPGTGAMGEGATIGQLGDAADQGARWIGRGAKNLTGMAGGAIGTAAGVIPYAASVIPQVAGNVLQTVGHSPQWGSKLEGAAEGMRQLARTPMNYAIGSAADLGHDLGLPDSVTRSGQSDTVGGVAPRGDEKVWGAGDQFDKARPIQEQLREQHRDAMGSSGLGRRAYDALMTTSDIAAETAPYAGLAKPLNILGRGVGESLGSVLPGRLGAISKFLLGGYGGQYGNMKLLNRPMGEIGHHATSTVAPYLPDQVLPTANPDPSGLESTMKYWGPRIATVGGSAGAMREEAMRRQQEQAAQNMNKEGSEFRDWFSKLATSGLPNPVGAATQAVPPAPTPTPSPSPSPSPSPLGPKPPVAPLPTAPRPPAPPAAPPIAPPPKPPQAVQPPTTGPVVPDPVPLTKPAPLVGSAAGPTATQPVGPAVPTKPTAPPAPNAEHLNRLGEFEQELTGDPKIAVKQLSGNQDLRWQYDKQTADFMAHTAKVLPSLQPADQVRAAHVIAQRQGLLARAAGGDPIASVNRVATGQAGEQDIAQAARNYAKTNPQVAQQPNFFENFMQSFNTMPPMNKAMMVLGIPVALAGLFGALGGKNPVAGLLMALVGGGAAYMGASQGGMVGKLMGGQPAAGPASATAAAIHKNPQALASMSAGALKQLAAGSPEEVKQLMIGPLASLPPEQGIVVMRRLAAVDPASAQKIKQLAGYHQASGLTLQSAALGSGIPADKLKILANMAAQVNAGQPAG